MLLPFDSEVGVLETKTLNIANEASYLLLPEILEGRHQ
jgi:hypothetical protein